LNSMSLSQTPMTLKMVEEARSHGVDVTTEAYPYSAGMTLIESALFDRFENVPDSMYQKIMWVQTGERMTRETFQKFRKQGGGAILFLNTPEMEAMAINSPLTAIASDGGINEGKGHPRTSGTYARVLGHYVREEKSLTLNEAIRKMALLPAQRLEKLAPAFRNKGRIKLGADADIAVFAMSFIAALIALVSLATTLLAAGVLLQAASPRAETAIRVRAIFFTDFFLRMVASGCEENPLFAG